MIGKYLIIHFQKKFYLFQDIALGPIPSFQLIHFFWELKWLQIIPDKNLSTFALKIYRKNQIDLHMVYYYNKEDL